MSGLDFTKPENVVLGAIIATFWLFALIFLAPFAILIAVAGLGYWLVTAIYNRPAARMARGRADAERLYEAALALQKAKGFPEAEAFRSRVWGRLYELLDERYPSLGIAAEMVTLIEALYRAEGFTGEIPKPPEEVGEIELARYRDRIGALTAKFGRPEVIERAYETLLLALWDFCRLLPPNALQTRDELLEAAEAGSMAGPFAIRLMEALPKTGEAVEALAFPFYRRDAIDAGLFAGLRERLSRNQLGASGLPYEPRFYDSPKLVNPSDHEGSPHEIVHAYLKETPFEGLFSAGIPLEIPDSARFEHHWIVAGSGHGKSQTLQYLIAHDLDRVARGEGSVVVIDSQGDLIRNIAGLKMFAPGEPLAGRLCLIDPTDIEYPLALNLFDAGMERIGSYPPLERERLINGILELYDFVLGSLLSAELTQKQSVIFRYITRLMLHIPDATIHTFRELMEPKGYERYQSHIEKLDGTARAFFETEFMSKQFEETKRQVVRRLWGILENRTFERMFSHPRNKLDLFREMNAGKVILINTAKDLLKQNGTEIFGRFFIALIAQAAQERATLARGDRLPTFVYVDECADYLDQNVSVILEQARKFNVGMVLAHQYIGQLSPKLQESFAANTSIKFAGGVSEKDARALAHMLRTTPEFISVQGKGQFAVSIRNMIEGAISLGFPFGYLESRPRMNAEEAAAVRSEMRERYAVHWQDVERERKEKETSKTRAEPAAPAIRSAPIDTAPSSDW